MTALAVLLVMQGSPLPEGGKGAGVTKPAYPPFVKKELYATNDLRGKAAPAFVFGAGVNRAVPATKGKVVVVDFWATWCPPCRETIPELNALAAKFPNDVVVIGVSDEPVATLKTFMAKTPMSYAVTSDPKGVMKKAVGVQGIPHVLVISPDGIVRWQGFPLDEKDRLTQAKVAMIVSASKGSGK